METTISPAELASDFRYALDVMEESDHLGLDVEHARIMHDILQRRIDEACAAMSAKPCSPVIVYEEEEVPA
jgi:hypothetical protein